jgi:D-3-phosphoglycerate dehydrogenase
VVHEPVSFVNAHHRRASGAGRVGDALARDDDYVNLLVFRAETEDGRVDGRRHARGRRAASGWSGCSTSTSTWRRRYMAFFTYEDRPGVIGTVGSLLGTAGINIASMEVGRKAAGGLALMGLTVDSPIPADILQGIEREVGTEAARFLELPD